MPQELETWRDLLVQADSMLSAAGYGRAVTKDEMIALSARLRRAYEAPPTATVSPGWQPIATADTDVTAPVLLWTPHAMAVGYIDNGDWWILGSRSVIEPTHWMPLPDPPKDAT